MQKYFVQILVFIVSLMAALWAVINMSLLEEKLQYFAIGTIVLCAILALTFRKIPLNYKLICLLITGYAFAA